MSNSILTIALIFISILFGNQLHNDYLNFKRTSIVKLTNLEGTSGGTGFYVKAPSGKIVTMTNGHVCRLATDGVIISDDGRNKASVKVIAQYEDNDLCVVEAPSNIKSGLSVAHSVREGEDVYVLGHPLLMPKSLVPGEISGSVMAEVLQGVNIPCEGKTYKKIIPDPNDLGAMIFGIQWFCVRTTPSMVVTANILPGNSGSPILDILGHVVGVAFAGTWIWSRTYCTFG